MHRIEPGYRDCDAEAVEPGEAERYRVPVHIDRWYPSTAVCIVGGPLEFKKRLTRLGISRTFSIWITRLIPLISFNVAVTELALRK